MYYYTNCLPQLNIISSWTFTALNGLPYQYVRVIEIVQFVDPINKTCKHDSPGLTPKLMLNSNQLLTLTYSSLHYLRDNLQHIDSANDSFGINIWPCIRTTFFKNNYYSLANVQMHWTLFLKKKTQLPLLHSVGKLKNYFGSQDC